MVRPPASVGPQNWDAATSARAARTQRRQCPRRDTWCPCPPHLGECSPVEPPFACSLETLGAGALSPSSLTPKKHHGVPGPVAALDRGSVGVLGAAR